MRTNTLTGKFAEITFSDADVVNPDDYIPEGESNPHKMRPWLLHDAGFVLAICFADCEQDAIDEAADAGKLDRFLIDELDLMDYEPDDDRISYLGNFCKRYDIESLGIIELPNPPFSFTALFNAAR